MIHGEVWLIRTSSNNHPTLHISHWNRVRGRGTPKEGLNFENYLVGKLFFCWIIFVTSVFVIGLAR